MPRDVLKLVGDALRGGASPRRAIALAGDAFEENKHPRVKSGKGGGQFAKGGGGGAAPSTTRASGVSSQVSEMKHSTMPLPDHPSGRVGYDNVHSRGDDEETATVIRRPNGTYYADTGKFDFEAPDAATMRTKLAKMGYTKRAY